MPILTFLLIMIVFDLLGLLLGLILARFYRTHRIGIRLIAMSIFGTGLAPYICMDKGSDKCGSCGNWTCPLFCYRKKEVTE